MPSGAFFARFRKFGGLVGEELGLLGQDRRVLGGERAGRAVREVVDDEEPLLADVAPDVRQRVRGELADQPGGVGAVLSGVCPMCVADERDLSI
ncbi:MULTISPECIES: hypothetical protein [Actinomycetes]|uniref:hypothetical protein n=1 Tax=Actinomycetes TaxID=1760 RepID=UPI001319BF0D|nr:MULTISPECIES: hypothetical protein [Actinomycetes]